MNCITNVAKTNSHQISNNFIEQKFYGRVQIESAWSYYYFQPQGIAQRIIHHLKYENCPELGVELGKRYGQELREIVKKSEIDVILPVPLHFKKYKIRGYNQSECIAQGMSIALEIPVKNAIKRNKQTESQTSKSRIQRWNNVDSIFEIVDNSIDGKNVLLVDDVITTGATLEACVQSLKTNNCNVYIATIAAAK